MASARRPKSSPETGTLRAASAAALLRSHSSPAFATFSAATLYLSTAESTAEMHEEKASKAAAKEGSVTGVVCAASREAATVLPPGRTRLLRRAHWRAVRAPLEKTRARRQARSWMVLNPSWMKTDCCLRATRGAGACYSHGRHKTTSERGGVG